MFPERTNVYVMQLPDVVMSYSQQAQTKWLRQEGAELVQEASDAFDIIELMLGESPHFSSGGSAATGEAAAHSGGAAAGPGHITPGATAPAEAGDLAAGVSAASGAAGSSPSGSPSLAGAPGSGPGAAAPSAAAPPVLTQLLVAVRKDHQSFLALMADCMARCAPLVPAPAPAAAPAPGGIGHGASVPWDEQFISGVRELNRLRCVLAKAVLQWASRLQDPSGFVAHYNRLTSGGGGAGGGAGGQGIDMRDKRALLWER
jgi:hypothetical protein